MGFIVLDLTFLYISFAIFFCQKKSRKSVSPSPEFSLKVPTWGVRKNAGCVHAFCDEDLSAVVMWVWYEEMCCHALCHQCNIRKFSAVPCCFINKNIHCWIPFYNWPVRRFRLSVGFRPELIERAVRGCEADVSRMKRCRRGCKRKNGQPAFADSPPFYINVQ